MSTQPEPKPGWSTTEAGFTGLGGGAIFEMGRQILAADMDDLAKGIALAGCALGMAWVVGRYTVARTQIKSGGES